MNENECLLREIDSLKKENQSLKESLVLNETQGKEYSTLFDTMNEGVAFHDLVYDNSGFPVDYVIRQINPAFEKIFKINRTDVIGKTFSAVFGYISPNLEVYSKVSETGVPVSFEIYFASLSKYFRVSVYSKHKEKFAAIFEDITHRKQLELALKEKIIRLTSPIDDISNVRFEDLFNIDEIQKIQDAFASATGTAALITDTEGNPITKPSNFCDLCTNIIRKSPKGGANCRKSDIIIGNAGVDGPVFQTCLSGGLIDGAANITIGNYHIANWLVGQVVLEDVNKDLTLEYARQIEVDEVEFKKEFDKVPKMSKERFQAIADALFIIANQISVLALNNLQQARLITSITKNEEKIKALNAELIEKNNELEQIVYVSSHDLRSPLVNIQGFTKVLNEGFDELRNEILSENGLESIRKKTETIINKEMPEAFKFIFGSTKKMDALISGLLKFSRLGRTALNSKLINMNELISEVIKTFEYQIASLGVEVTFSALPNCFGDELLINQVFSNLIDNALKYRENKRKGKITISGIIKNGLAVYTVEDNGKGIPEKFHNQIFDLFKRLDLNSPGEGIGLALVKKIIDKHNGSLWVESESSLGSRFSFSLSVKQAEHE